MARPPKNKNPNTPPEPTEAEVEILRVFWNSGPATIRDVWEKLGSKGSYTTVLKQCQVMFEKGLVLRDDSERTHIYRAAQPKQKIRRSMVGRLLDQVFEGSAAQLVLGALSAKRVSAQERDEIRRLLDEMDQAEGHASNNKDA